MIFILPQTCPSCSGGDSKGTKEKTQFFNLGVLSAFVVKPDGYRVSSLPLLSGRLAYRQAGSMYLFVKQPLDYSG